MIDKILYKFGYVKGTPHYTEDELYSMLVNLYSDFDFDLTKEQEEKIYEGASNVEGLVHLLKEITKKDLKRYFGANTDRDRDMIKGGFARTHYLIARLENTGKK